MRSAKDDHRTRMPTFCRHNHLIQNCPICSREQEIELRPIVSSSAPRTVQSRTAAPRPTGTRAASQRPGGRAGVKVSRLARGVDDGYQSPLVPGLRSSSDAERLADELGFAALRLQVLADEPPGLYAEVADPAVDIEERTWLAFLIAYISPLDGDEPFAAISQTRTPWASGEPPSLDRIELGARTAHDRARGGRTLEAYRAWVRRAGSQAVAFTGELAWSPERRFARTFERLALPGLHRAARFDLLVTLGRLGVYELTAGSLEFGGAGEVTLAAKRALGIGDSLLLERRARELAEASALPLAALDLGLYNWGRGERVGLGLAPGIEPGPSALQSIRAALGLD